MERVDGNLSDLSQPEALLPTLKLYPAKLDYIVTFYVLGAIFCYTVWILYSIYEDFTTNNDPTGRRLRSQNRKLRRKQKLLQRLRHEIQRETKLMNSNPNNNGEISSSSSSDATTDKSEEDWTKDSSFHTVTEDHNSNKSIEAQAQVGTNTLEIQPSTGFWDTLRTKVNDFFSDEVVVPESDTDEEDTSASSFVIIPEPGSAPLCVSSTSYRKLRMNLIRHGHSWDPNL